MSAIWLMWCERAMYVRARREIKARGEEGRFVRLSSVSDVREVVFGFGDGELNALVGVSGDVERLECAERLLGELARTGRLTEIVACMDEVDAGSAARCFHAGATEIVAVGSVPSRTSGYDMACIEEEMAAPELACDEGRDALPSDAGEEVYAVEADEVPPWDVDVDRYTSVGWEETGDFEEGPVCEEMDVEVDGPHAPVITVVSARGGVGKTTLVAAMAACAARAGLRAAVLDLDLMFGNLSEVLGVEGLRGIEGVGAHADGGCLAERDVEESAMRVGPGLTLWGPCAAPEHAELCAPSIEQLVGVLRGVADVIFVDTSNLWGDAAAMAVAACDRCLVVGGAGASAPTSARRVVELAARLGVPRTRMTCVFNRMGARGAGEEQALAFEMGTGLRSRARIVDGGDEVAGMLSFGQVNGLVAGSGVFAQSVRAFTSSLLQELGCPIAQWLLDEEQRRGAERRRGRFRLPWQREAGDLL